MIIIENLVKKYKKTFTNAVDGVSFNVRPGQFFALLGPNGAGKTTILSVLSTTLNKTAGKVKIAGFDLDKKPDQIRQKIGVVFQRPSLDWNLSAEENIRFHASLYGTYPFRLVYQMMPKSYKKRVTDLAGLLGIENEIFKPIKTFSGGMRRKLEIVRSLIHKPKILFLDEPTAGLDPESRINLWRYLKDVRRKEETTIFLTTHYLQEAEDTDLVGIINRGRLIALDHPKKIKDKIHLPTLEEAYLEIVSQPQ